MKYIKLFFANMLNSKGRTSLKDFWVTYLYLMLFALVLGFAISFVSGLFNNESVTRFLLVYTNVAILFATISLQIRRLHDSNKSALYLLLNLLPGVGQIIVIALLCLPGNLEVNSYGPPTSI